MPARRRFAIALLAIALPLVVSPVAAQGAKYHVAKEIPIGGDGSWDYLSVDTTNRRLFVSHATHVVVIDLARDAVIGDIANTPGVHGAAFAPDLNRGFTSNGRDSTVTIFNLKTLAEIGRVTVTGRNPDAIYYDPSTKRIFTMNAGGSITALDAATGSVLGSIPVGGKPETAVGDGTGRMFVNVEDKNEIMVFDGRTMKEIARWPIDPCESPTGLDLDRAHNRLFAGCSKTSVVVDAKTGKVVATVPVGNGVDAAAFDPGTQLAFAPNGGDGTVTIIHEDSPDKFTVVGTAESRVRGRTLALDPKTHRIYVSFAKFGPVPADSSARVGRGRSRAPMIPNSFAVVVLEPAP
jgi:DNA-binding beta-propeller fold protein YncE